MIGIGEILVLIAVIIIMSFINIKGGGWGTRTGYKECSQDESKALDYNDDINKKKEK